MSDIKEPGAASINITLSHGVITVTHGTAGDTLAEWTASKGDWERLWETINTLKAVA